ncbi:hypothetical protein NL676_030854 [Syzygium grande]|nr:hypothetical protein NL676_030854 [Syzygium grande]
MQNLCSPLPPSPGCLHCWLLPVERASAGTSLGATLRCSSRFPIFEILLSLLHFLTIGRTEALVLDLDLVEPSPYLLSPMEMRSNVIGS